MYSPIEVIDINAIVKFSSQFEKANGEWKILNLRADEVFMGRLGKQGQLLKANAQNMLNLKRSMLDAAIEVGTCEVLVGVVPQ